MSETLALWYGIWKGPKLFFWNYEEYVWRGAHDCYSECVEVRGQLAGVSSLSALQALGVSVLSQSWL